MERLRQKQLQLPFWTGVCKWAFKTPENEASGCLETSGTKYLERQRQISEMIPALELSTDSVAYKPPTVSNSVCRSTGRRPTEMSCKDFSTPQAATWARRTTAESAWTHSHIPTTCYLSTPHSSIHIAEQQQSDLVSPQATLTYCFLQSLPILILFWDLNLHVNMRHNL